jgi:hypothetical protein
MVRDDNPGMVDTSDLYAIPRIGDITPFELINTNLSFRSPVDVYQTPCLTKTNFLSLVARDYGN